MAEQEKSFFVTDQNDIFQRPVLIGNGELVTCFGPSGYHADQPLPWMQVFCMAGRRMSGPCAALIRYGQLKRRLMIGDEESVASSFEQELVPTQGIVLSHNTHALLDENTTSFVCLEENAAAFKTTLTNTSDQTINGTFVLDYKFGDWDGGLPECSYFHCENIQNGVLMQHSLEKIHLGGVELQCDQKAKFTTDNSSVLIEWPFEIQPGESKSVSFLWGIGDKRHYRYVTKSWSFDDMLSRQKSAWNKFFTISELKFDNPELEALRDICLYDLRCNSTPWSIPPAVSPCQWEGRTFHDEMYPFLGLASGSRLDLASKIPYYRLRTLDKAIERSHYKGAKYAWESLENGEDGSPYGAWLEEYFHMGQFAESAWQLCLYDGSREMREEFYPLFKEIADFYLLNLVEPDGQYARIRSCTDYDESTYPVTNGMYTACAAIRSMEIATKVGKELGESPDKTSQWQGAAAKLRKNMPRLEREDRYLTAAGAKHRHIAEVGPVFPFRLDKGSSTAYSTMDSFCKAVETESGLQPGDTASYGKRRWMWTSSHVATAYSLLGNTDRAYEILLDTPKATGPGLTPAEQVGLDGGVSQPFFTTGAGALVFSVNSLFVQVSDDGITRLPKLPDGIKNAWYNHLAGAGGLKVSATFSGGKAYDLRIETPRDCSPEILVCDEQFPAKITSWIHVVNWSKEGSYYRLMLNLKKGNNVWKP